MTDPTSSDNGVSDPTLPVFGCWVSNPQVWSCHCPSGFYQPGSKATCPNCSRARPPMDWPDRERPWNRPVVEQPDAPAPEESDDAP